MLSRCQKKIYLLNQFHFRNPWRQFQRDTQDYDMYLSIYLYIRDADFDVSLIETQPSAGDNHIEKVRATRHFLRSA